MKKAIALLLAVLMVFALAACAKTATKENPASGNNNTASPAVDANTPAAGASDTGTPDTGASDNGKTDAVTPNSGASSDTASDANADVSSSANALGFFNSGVDPNSRDTYNIAWLYMRPMAVFQNIYTVLTEMESLLNFKTTEYCANSDIDALIQNIEIYADQGIDGFLIVIDATANVRICEVLDETGIPYIAMLNSVQDSNGSSLVPCVGLDNYEVGEKLTQWLFDNYKTYWGDIDETKIGLLNFNFSPNVDFNNRYLGSLARFKELLPNNTQIFDADGVTGGLNEQTGYDLASAILSANPDVEYWFIPACLELYAQGATRVVESLGIDDKVLTTCCDSNILAGAWDTNYEGSWVSCLAVSGHQYAVPGICGLVAILDGKATMETIWSSIRKPTDKLSFYQIANEIVTKDTYQAFFDKVIADSGLA